MSVDAASEANYVRAMSRTNEPLSPRLRFRGCLLGGAIGDALGAPVEFMSLAAIRQRFGDAGIRDYAPAYGRLGAITDDTQMTLFTGEGLLHAIERSQARGTVTAYVSFVAEAYLRWLETQGEPTRVAPQTRGGLLDVPELHSRRGPGATCLAALRDRTDFIAAARNESKGCGGVMRIAPLAMFAHAALMNDTQIQRASAELSDAARRALREATDFLDRDSIQRWFDIGAEVAGLTHGHPSGQLPAGFLTIVLALVLGGVPLEGALDRAQAALVTRAGHEETLRAVQDARAAAARAPADAMVLHELGEGWVAEEALAIGLYCALSAADFASGVVLAVNHDGDSDSTGAIAGQLLGAGLGEGAIPARWLAALELREVIADMADRLAGVSAI
jgi:ADP-ribosylglycohydrolase